MEDVNVFDALIYMSSDFHKTALIAYKDNFINTCEDIKSILIKVANIDNDKSVNIIPIMHRSKWSNYDAIIIKDDKNNHSLMIEMSDIHIAISSYIDEATSRKTWALFDVVLNYDRMKVVLSEYAYNDMMRLIESVRNKIIELQSIRGE